MENIDLNIENYTFEDILRLFKLSSNYDIHQLNEKKSILIKIDPENSQLDNKYYDFFLKAYNVLNNKLNEQILLENKKKEIELEKEIKDNAFIQKNIIVTNDANGSCYKPYDYIAQIVTIHTEDRDILKYPYQNSFEVQLPQVYKNVLSLELFDIKLPKFYYNISDYLQNTKLWFSIPNFFTDPIELVMLSGYYNEPNFTKELTNALNKTTTTFLYSIGAYVTTDASYSNFDVKLNPYTNKLEIYNIKHEFKFWCQKKSNYDDCVRYNWDFKTNWGLPYNMGFYRFLYTSSYDEKKDIFFLIPPDIIDIDLNGTIYMEIEKYNYIDEIVPYAINTNGMYNNDYNGVVNSAFAKLILSEITNSYTPVDKFIRILPHIEGKIAKLKFRFRYHNGNLVDFLNQNFDFSLKIVTRFDCKYTT
jgi:hypothetical protein